MFDVYSDEVLIHDDLIPDASVLHLIDPTWTLEDNAAGSFEFTVPKTNPGYSEIKRINSTISIYKDTYLVWQGRPISTTEDFWGRKKFVCEGTLAFLNDSVQDQHIYKNYTIEQYLKAIIAVHNQKVPRTRKITVGQVTFGNTKHTFKTNFENTLVAIRDNLLDVYGGHLRVRYVSGTDARLDYFADYPTTSKQIINFGDNLLDFTKNWDLTNLVTAIYPRGKRLDKKASNGEYKYVSIASVNNDDPYVTNDNGIDAFGRIERVVDFSDSEDAANLYSRALNYIRNVQFDDMTLDISAVDLHYLNHQIDQFDLLDQVHVYSKPHGLDRYFPVTKIVTPLLSPQNTTYTMNGTFSSNITGAVTKNGKQTAYLSMDPYRIPFSDNQHFWYDDTGVYITDDSQNNWKAEYEKENHGELAQPTTGNPWHNIYMNSAAIYLRRGLRYMTTITESYLAFYDGKGEGVNNVLAKFGRDEVQIGAANAKHMVINANGFDVYNANGTLGEIHASNIAADHARIEELEATKADITTLEAEYATIQDLNAEKGRITNLEAADATFTGLITSAEGRIADLEAADVTISNNLTAANGRIDTLQSTKADISTLESDYATITALNAEKARIDTLEGDSVTLSGRLTAAEADIDSLETNKADISTLEANYATITALNAEKARIDTLESTSVTTTYLQANYIDASTIEADYAKVDFTNVGTSVISTAMIKDGAVSNAKISDVSANKLTAGTIDANVITVQNLKAEDISVSRINGQPVVGKTVVDALSQHETDISDLDAKVDSEVDALNDRIDAAIETYTGTVVPTLNNYPASSWNTADLRKEHVGDVYYVVNSQSSAEGYCYRFAFDNSSSTYKWVLIKDSDVTAALSRITAAEGNISNLQSFETSTSTWIMQTDQGLETIRQNHTTLEGKVTDLEDEVDLKVDSTTFNEVKDTVDEHTSSISTLTTTVESKADSSTVTTLSNTVNSVQQTANANSSSISQLTTTVNQKADSSTVTTLTNRVSDVEQDLDTFKTTVASTYATDSDLDGFESRVSSAESTITQHSADILLKANSSDVYTKEETDALANLSASITGTVVRATDAASEPPISLTVYGRSVQNGSPTPSAPAAIQSVTGNLYRETVYEIGQTWTSTVSVTKADYNRYIVNGKSNGTHWLWGGGNNADDRLFVTLPAGTYTAVLGGADASNFSIATRGKINGSVTALSTSGNPNTFTIDSEIPVEVAIYTLANETFSNSEVSIQLYEGSSADGSFVPYGSMGLKAVGKNLLDLASSNGGTSAGLTVTPNGDGTFAVSGTATGVSVNVWLAGTYSNSAPVLFTLPAGTYTLTDARLFYHTTVIGSATTLVSGRSVTFTLDEETPISAIRCPNAVTGTTYDTTIYPQLELGSTATAYQPYVGTVTPIDLQGNQLRSLPDGTRDELTVDAQGNVTLTRRVGSYTVTGSETITSGTDLSGWRRGYVHVLQDAPSKKGAEHLGNGRGLCTHAPYLANYSIRTNHTYANISDVFMFAQVSTDADLLAAYTGATILYPLATPQTIDLGAIKLPTLPSPEFTAWIVNTTDFDLDYWRIGNGATVGRQFSEEVEARNAAIKVASDEINLSVEGQFKITNKNLSGLSTRLTTAEANIQTTAEGLNLKANQADVFNEVSNGTTTTYVGKWEESIAVERGRISAEVKARESLSEKLDDEISAREDTDGTVSALSSRVELTEQSLTTTFTDISGLKTLIYDTSAGTLVAKEGSSVGALVNSSGTFDIVQLTWSTGNPPLPAVSGEALTTIGANISRMGLTSGFHIDISTNSSNEPELGFYNKDAKLAYFNANVMYVPYTVSLNAMRVGPWVWDVDDDENLNLDWVDE